MGATTGIAAIGTYDSDVVSENIDELIALIPDPDLMNATSSGAQAGGGNLDEMSPIAAAHLRVELAAIKAAGGTGVPLAAGRYTCVAADATANLVNIVTGVADLTAAEWCVTIWRAGSIIQSDQAVTEPSAGTIRVADGAMTYVVTAGDIIVWAVVDTPA